MASSPIARNRRAGSRKKDQPLASVQIEALALEPFDLPFDALVNACVICIVVPAEMLDALLVYLPRFRSNPAETGALENVNGLL
jgi:hypothetical protein